MNLRIRNVEAIRIILSSLYYIAYELAELVGAQFFRNILQVLRRHCQLFLEKPLLPPVALIRATCSILINTRWPLEQSINTSWPLEHCTTFMRVNRLRFDNATDELLKLFSNLCLRRRFVFLLLLACPLGTCLARCRANEFALNFHCQHSHLKQQNNLSTIRCRKLENYKPDANNPDVNEQCIKPRC